VSAHHAPRRLAARLALALCALTSLTLPAQPVQPHLGYVYPAGGRQGTEFEAALGGQFLNGATNLIISGTGVTAVVRETEKPITPAQANDLREQMKRLQAKRQADGQGTNAFTSADRRELLDIRKKLATFIRRPANPAIAEKVLLAITVAPDADPGQRELRILNAQGLSNPLSFQVGRLPETREPTPPAELSFRPGKQLPRDGSEPRDTPPTDMQVTLPVVINGQILPGEADRYRFHARRGEKLVFQVAARDLIPYLADAVPGWFQASLAVLDAKGRELAYDDDYRFHPDPVVFFTVPSDGEYSLVIKDALYRGREDFVYRITAGELPFITSIFPLGGPVGRPTTVQLRGWNLDTNQVMVAPGAPGSLPVTARHGDHVSPAVPFAADTLPECAETEPNNTPASAQPIALPMIINGRVDAPGDADVFKFTGRAGERVVAEVTARRLGSPLDSVLRLTDAQGRELAYNDDCDDLGEGLETHHADSYLSLTLPADGDYFLTLRDAQKAGGPDYAYRLRVSAPRPDFALRVSPSAVTLRAGATVPLSVRALRRDGFTNEIRLLLRDAPAGFTLGGARVPAGEDQVRVTLSGPPAVRDLPVPLVLVGAANVDGKTVTREALAAEDEMQAFFYRHLVTANHLEAMLIGRSRPRAPVAQILDEMPVRIPAGGEAHVSVRLPPNLFFAKVELELNDPPAGVAMQKVSSNGGGVSELLLAADAVKAKPGTRGNLIVTAFMDNPGAAGKGKAATNRRRVAAGTLPAIPFEITTAAR